MNFFQLQLHTWKHFTNFQLKYFNLIKIVRWIFFNYNYILENMSQFSSQNTWNSSQNYWFLQITFSENAIRFFLLIQRFEIYKIKPNYFSLQIIQLKILSTQMHIFQKSQTVKFQGNQHFELNFPFSFKEMKEPMCSFQMKYHSISPWH